jgi:kynurenine formamidase
MRAYDFTMVMDNFTPIFPGDKKQEIVQESTIAKDGWNDKRLSFNSHFSTHIDAPIHMVEGAKSLTDFPIERFMGEAIIIDVRGQSEINTADLSTVKAGDIVFFFTGQTDKAGSEDFFKNNPVITEAMAKKLIKKKVRIVGLDSYTPDNAPFTVHKMLFRKDIMIVENLVGLKQLSGKRFMCYIMPLKIRDADGAPCRVVGITD